MSLIGYTTTRYTEDRRPADDAASVGRWIIGPVVVASFLGAAMFGGLAGMSEFDGGVFVFSAFLFGGGFLGFVMMVLRVLTYDKRPYVTIKETTQEPVREAPEPQQPIRGNAAPTYTQPNGDVTIEHGDLKHKFSSRQMRLMLDRVEDENYQVAQNAFEIAPGQEYNDVCTIMSNLDYWRVWRRAGKISRVEWQDSGVAWLRANAR